MELKNEIVEMLSEKKVFDIKEYPFDTILGEFSFLVVGSVDNMTHGNAVVEEVYKHYQKAGCKVKKQGNRDSKWLVVVIEDVVLHIFLQSEREYYQVDEIWGNLA